MNPANFPSEDEQRLHRLLRSLPDRAAPAALEGRVMAGIARHAARRHWLRAGMSALSAAAAVAFSVGPGPISGALARHSKWFADLQSLEQSLAGSLRDLAGAVPPSLLHGSLIAIAACYAILAGLAAAGYHLLIKGRARLTHSLTP